ncbi:type II toxin-antitoxin system RelE/ParE family toxin [Leptospira langatensis]|uniref:Type II toxin-antitoxin system RelE/ParE family toxin n=1 Tax=Leptospira langatensis TaxID=2484983 RepID=A0A5F1ZPG9_9LEPT|nr:type II toxin-antitoxin system RelE/ParE family toxin [Leptospira langatensis]TGK05461.1 type II toxin-antitoxin system RelE/ParE family toxin [Leptospira langatensis]TGL38597.1 type II toxin-antitoxin system RelE/ParE family toxin [Leptospira langatensis]
MSHLEVRIKPSAEQDIIQAVAYYNSQKENLGYEFLLEIDHSLERVSYFPKIGPIVYKNFRQLLTRRFPFRIFYRISDNQYIDIYAVLHQSREFRKLFL